jgi:cytoskeletal protein CcmA (bactofilin family)
MHHRFHIPLIACWLLTLSLPAQDIWRIGEERIQLTAPVTRDAFLLANDIRVESEVQDDLWAAGRQVRFLGSARDDVRLAGLEVLMIDGPIDGDLTAVAGVGNLVVSTNTVLKGSALLKGNQQITVKGSLGGDVHVIGPRTEIHADIAGNLFLEADDIRILPGTRIQGNLYYPGESRIPLPAGVQLEGEQLPRPRGSSNLQQTLGQWKTLLWFAQWLNAFWIGLLLLRLLPRTMLQCVDQLLQRRGPVLTIGSLTLILGSLAGYFLLPSIFATGLGIFLLLGTGLFFYTGKIVVAMALGVYLLRKRESFSFKTLAVALLLGLLLLYLLFSVALIGTPIYILVSCLGMGSLLNSLRASQRIAPPFSAVQPPPPQTPPDKDLP